MMKIMIKKAFRHLIAVIIVLAILIAGTVIRERNQYSRFVETCNKDALVNLSTEKIKDILEEKFLNYEFIKTKGKKKYLIFFPNTILAMFDLEEKCIVSLIEGKSSGVRFQEGF